MKTSKFTTLVLIGTTLLTSCTIDTRSEQDKKIDYVSDNQESLFNEPYKLKQLLDEIAYNANDQWGCSSVLLGSLMGSNISIKEVKEACK